MQHRYGDGRQFLSSFDPSVQMYAARFPLRAYRGVAPTLECVAEGYGSAVAIVWICMQLEDVNLFASVKEKLPVARQKELAKLILTEYPFLKTSELLLFFHRLKCGRYGRFYGAVDALFITSALLQFLQERGKERRQYAAEAAEARRRAETEAKKKAEAEAESRTMTRQEYFLWKNQNRKENEEE